MRRLTALITIIGAMIAGLLTAATPATAAPCVSVAYSGKEFGSSYAVKFTSSCPGTTYVNYIFDDGSRTFSAQTSGLASVSSFGSTEYISLRNVAPGTYTPSVQWTEQGTYETGRATLASYTISGTSTPTLPGPTYTPPPAPPRLPACSTASIPTITGKQDSITSVTFSWNAIPGTTRYMVKESRFVGGTWVRPEDWSSTANTSYTYTGLAVGDLVSILVYADCAGSFQVPPGPVVTVAAPTPIPPAFNPATTNLDWVCFPAGQVFSCSAVERYTSRKPFTTAKARALRSAFIRDLYQDLASNGIQYSATPTVALERPNKKTVRVTVDVMAIPKMSTWT
jgi:hypothetical protein